MKWLNQYRENQRMKTIAKRYETQGSLARQCVECEFWIYRDEKPRNWVCRCPTELKMRGYTCLSWQQRKHKTIRIGVRRPELQTPV